MTFPIRIIIFLFGLAFIIGTIRLLLKKRITERYSVFWLIGCFIILIFSIFPNLIDLTAGLLHVSYPPTLIFVFTTLLLFWLCLYNSIHITILKRQVIELTQQKALDDALNNFEKRVNS